MWQDFSHGSFSKSKWKQKPKTKKKLLWKKSKKNEFNFKAVKIIKRKNSKNIRQQLPISTKPCGNVTWQSNATFASPVAPANFFRRWPTHKNLYKLLPDVSWIFHGNALQQDRLSMALLGVFFALINALDKNKQFGGQRNNATSQSWNASSYFSLPNG